jgi:hypothetical protein
MQIEVMLGGRATARPYVTVLVGTRRASVLI